MEETVIEFEFEGRKYTVGLEAYDSDHIKLPDGRTLRVINGWQETTPPRPRKLVEIPPEEVEGEPGLATAA